MLGPFEVRLGDGTVADVQGSRLRALVIALALQPGAVVRKDALVDWIWGERPPAEAANALHRLVSRLRKALPEGSVEGRADGYRLAIAPDDVDAVRFERLAAPGDETGAPRLHALREALALWRGAAMHGVDLPDSTGFDAAATRLERLRRTVAEDRYDAEAAAGNGAGLITELTDLLAEDPLRERIAAALMRALAAAGRDSEALLVYRRTGEALADALGADPSPELAGLHVALLRGEVGRREERRRTNLRAELTSFIGRDEEVASVGGLVAGNRLTTLIGPGGSGKTRLAAETAHTLLGDLPDGAWMVELAAIGADGDVAQAVLAGLGLRDALRGDAPGDSATERAVAALRDQEVLLVLDNCEHVIDAAAAFAHRVLGECRGLRVLATSREPLGITGEVLWPVAPLALPRSGDDPDAIAASPAVRLLRDRASAVRQDLDGDAATMARVARALDGMPLAIELAAARLRVMSLQQLADRLDDRFQLLTGGSRTALPRHKTLRAVIDWSWDLLDDDEKLVLRRLSVFASGAGLEAAEQVCASDTVAPGRVLDLLTALTEKSLLIAGGDRAPRYRMLGTIKEYAGQRLADAGEAGLARRAHLAHVTGLVETAEPHLYRGEQLEWLALLEAEHDDIAAAMRGAIAAGEAQEAMRLAAAAGWYWWLGGHKAEGDELIRAATALPGEVDDAVRAVVYARAVHAGIHNGRTVRDLAAWGPGDRDQAEEWLGKAYEISLRVPPGHRAIRFTAALERLVHAPGEAAPAFESLLDDEDPWLAALARLHLGRLRIVLGLHGTEADAHLEAALAAFRSLGDRWGTSFALTELANRIAMRGEFAAACELYEQAVAVMTEFGANEDAVSVRSRQAQLRFLAGDPAAAACAMAEARRTAERIAWPNALAELALAQAELARWSGDAPQARERLDAFSDLLGDDSKRAHVRAVRHDLLGYLAEDAGTARGHRLAAVEAAVETAHAPLTAQVLVGVADQALRSGDHALAVRLLLAGAAVRGLQDRSHPDVLRIEEASRASLGDAGFAAAAAEGAGADWRALVATALAP
ncbi:BTAD domain-containing putative transcriptional regulator [Glycomyces endophyticus]|uniref:BTAD domain-containing putative transcriptional regulator n=2 Tax=Glycomyces endophyticus TaxID=480996 RepID=A0ABN2H2X0_9ACTN